MNDTQTVGAELNARIRALDDFGRKSVLNYLAGYAPEELAVALDEIELQKAAITERLAAAQATEDSHG